MRNQGSLVRPPNVRALQEGWSKRSLLCFAVTVEGETEDLVAWLATKSRMRCSTPYCRAVIALDEPAHRMVIDRLVAQATEIALLVSLERSS